MEEMFKDTLDQQPMARFLSPPADSSSSREPIAIIGMGCRFPGANSPEDFWRLLCNEVDAITEVPADRFAIDALYDPRPGLVGKVVTRWGGFLNGVDQFDASFFGISPHAASRMDPQYRLLLEVAWEALEDAGIAREQLVGSKTGVFIGMTTGDYQDLQCRNPDEIDVYVVMGGLRSVASGRISYAFDLQGPSLVVDTACTSSLTALHLACQSLRAGECSMALVGGSHLILQPELTLGFSTAGMMSPDGHCKFGDANANGYVRSEGVGVLVLKPLGQALADGDPIHALIRGSATNNDGRSGKSLVTPGYDAQVAVLRDAYRDANVRPRQVHYVEAHGTGTSVGDATEIRALATVLGEGRALDRPCHIGSVKTNIGHTEGAAGMASLIKAVLCLKHRALPKSLYCENPNPVLPWSEVPLVIQQTLEPLAAQDEPILVGVSAFGVSGTNAHIILEEAKQPASDVTTNDASDRAYLFPLSAHTSEALVALARSYQAFAPEYALADVCYTAGVRRTHHAHRLALVVRSYEELHAQLDNFLQGRADPHVASGGVRSDIPQQCFDQLDQIETALPSLRHGKEEYTAQLRSLALLYTLGCPIAWSKLYPAGSRCVSLPSYPWQHERFWMKTDTRDAYNRPPVRERQGDVSSHPLLGHHWTSAVQSATHFWETFLSTDLFPYLNDHRVQGAVVLPAAAYAEIVLAAAKEVFHIVPVLKDITFKKAIFLSDRREKRVQLVLTLERPDVATFQFFSQEESDGTGQPTWTFHASGMALTDLSAVQLSASEWETPEQIQARCQQVYTGQKYYQSLALRGLRYGPSFQTIAEIARRDGEALGRIQLDEQVVADSRAYLVHPALLDGCFQAILAALPENMSKTATYIPVRLKSLQISDHLGQRLWSHAVLREVRADKPDIIEGDVSLIDEQGRVVFASLELMGMRIEEALEEKPIRDWLYEWRWEARPWSQIERSLKILPDGPWLIFADRLGIGEQLSRLLTVSGRDCVLAFRGTSYQQLTPQLYLLDPSSSQDFQRLLRGTSSASGPFCGIIHLWSVDAHPATGKTSASIEEAQQAGVLSVMHLVQALASLGGDRTPHVYLVTCGAQPVDPSSDVLSVEQAPISGLGRVLVNEHPELQCRRIDLERADVSTLAQLLFWELQVGDREDEVALSREARFVHRLVRCETAVVENKPSLFRPDATYLIAGGLGGLGLTVADWMVRQGARYLVLAGRSGASSEADQVIATLREMSTQVVIAKADVSEEQEVADLLTTIQTSLPPLRGLIHAAAVLDDGVLLQLDEQRFRKVMAPKINGAWNLHTLTAHLELDFFVLFSSAAELLGLPGQGNYVAANEFLDVLAHHRRQLGLPALSINWGTWSEVGMAASRTGAVGTGFTPVRSTGERLALRGMSSLAPKLGLDALTYLLSQDRPQVAVMSVDWPQWHLFYPAFADSPVLTHLMAQSQAMTHTIVQAAQETLQAPILTTQPEERLELVTHYLDEQISQALGLGAEKSHRDLPLIEQGLDSLMAVELKNKIQAGLGVSVTVTKLLQSASTVQLALDIFEQLQTAFTHQLADKIGKNNEQSKLIQEDPGFILTQIPSLVVKERTEPLPLSFAQLRLWFLDKMFPGSTNYNVPVIVRLTGTLNIQALQQSLQEIIRRHEALRTTFDTVNGQPIQVISSDASLSLPLVDLCACRLEEREQTAMRLATEEAQERPFDLERGPLFRAQLLCLSPSQYWLLITVHHIVFDAWSFGVLLRELSALYTANVQGQPSPLADLPIQYGDYTIFQHEQMQGKLLNDQLAYWKERLAGAPLVLELPTDHPRPAVESYRGTRFFFRFSPSLMEGVADLSRREGVTLFMTMLAAWQIVLGRTSQQDDFLVGSPIAGRQRIEMEKLIGFLVNTLVLRVQLAGHLTFRELLKQVKETTLAAYEHQDVPFERLVEVLHPQRDLSRSPVFQVMFILQNMTLPPLELPGLSATASEGPCTTSRFDLFINLWEKADFDHWIEYPTDLFEEGTIARIVEHCQRVLEQVVTNADQPIASISLLTEHEKHQVLNEWNRPINHYPVNQCIHQLFMQQAQRTPDAVAAFYGDQHISYSELDRRSTQLALFLQALGVGLEARVGVYMERSLEVLIGLLGVLKAGGAYVPLDASSPRDRLAFMIHDAQIVVLIIQECQRVVLPPLSLPVISIDSDWSSIDTTYPQTLIQDTTPENLAYIIYTSGSTGRPKGVMGTHGAMLNRFAWMWHTYPFEQNEVCCQKTSLNFVDSIWEIFGPLIKGRPIVVIAEDVVKDLALFVARLAEHNVTRLVLVPSLLQAMLEVYPDLGERLPALQLWTCSGEALSGDLFSQFTHSLKGRRLLNLYGSSEVAADVTWHMATDDLTDSSWVPIGRPIDNIHTYILDAHLQLVPPGGVGTLYIGGVGQARGYLHLPDLTAERFVPHPFVGKGLAPFQLSERLYRTGDLARYRADGVLEYLGRIDQQVKIRGFRIELGEIEAVLHTHPGVRDAVIATYEDDPTNKKLVAYVLLKDSMLATEQLQDWLRKKVPEYMIPHVFMYLNAFPLTANGKLDRRSLPRPTPQYLEKQRTFVPPRTETEHQLTKIFADVLSLETIGIEDNIFDLGFHSLLVTRTAARIRETLQVDVSPPLFFEHWTIGRLAQYLQTTYGPAPTPRSTAVSTEIMTHQITPEAVTTDRVSPIKVSPIPPRQHSRVNHSFTHMSEQKGPTTASSIAIIGMSGVFPQAPDVQRLWNNLLMGRDCISEIPPSRWDWQTYFGHPAASNPNKTNVKWAGVVEDVETFDPQFFGISPREAELMDPQQRLLMMYVWKAIEDAGYSAESLSGTDTALFMGTASTGYSERSFKAGMVIDGYSATGLAPSMGPNRISYFLNLHGPSEAIETACSSSLVAIHRGVSAIESGQCTMAIVGGVNTIVSPEVHISMSKAGMLSEDGRCKTFSAQADGYVRSEGVGMLVLKKLSDAEQAGDHIYGVIRGSAENHGGRTSSLTAPNPRAQADLLIAAYRKAGIDPRTVSYIEAHGTGTPLGDPIEITGLKAAFGELAQIMEEEPWPVATCGIGSVKSHIGHLELAAGVTGVIKVLLQMQHKKLVKSLHCERLNPYIELEGSPFYIVQETREWEAQRDQMGNVLPRRAGVSSFGFGGVNAHVVLEEYVPKPRPPHPQSLPQPPALIVLSARNEERLHEQVRQLLAWIVGGTCQGCGRPQGSAERSSPPACACPMGAEEPPDLLDLAYTLQVGREPMEERLALQVGSLAELSEKLRTYLQSPQEVRDWYRGQTRQYRDIVALFDTDDELQEMIGKWLQKAKYEKLQQGWVKGLKIEWRHLYGEHLPCRISLPTYPFARERYWIPIGANPLATATSSTTTYGTNSPEGPRIQTPTLVALHPLVQRNTSTLWAQQFSSTFHGDEFFLADHVIKGQRILPAVAYLEMARAAVREAIGDDETLEPSQIRLSNVVWIRPLIISSHPVTVRIALEALESEAISFVIRSERQGEEAEEHIYCQGRALVEQAHERQAPIQSLDLPALQSRCQQQILASECYQRYRELGITYGPAMQAIEQLSVGEGMVLARLRLPVGVVPCADPGLVPRETQMRMEEVHGDGPYVLHPSMLDAALQACLGLVIGQPGMQELSLPFALSDLVIMGEARASGWAWVARRQGSTGESVFDIEVCDDEGRVAVHMGGLSTRAFLSGSSESPRTMLLTPEWKEETLVSSYPPEAYGQIERIKQRVLGQARDLPATGVGQIPEGRDKSQPLQVSIDGLREALTHIVSDLLKVEVAQIDAETALTEYGFDSITFTGFANHLNLTYQLDLAPPLFFEHSTIESLALYLQTTYAAVLAPHFTTGSPLAPGMARKDFVSAAPRATEQMSPVRQRPRATRWLMSMEDAKATAAATPIAIIGMSGAFPQAPDVQSLWSNLIAGRDCIGEIPQDRWDWQTSFGSSTSEVSSTDIKWAGILAGIELFDPLFFGISPREAELMDPQQRLLMMYVWKAIEDAGYDASSLSGTNTALFVGTGSSGYGEQASRANVEVEGYSSTGLAPSMGPGRMSYFLNLHGPSEAIDTACSSSLVAIHRGVNAIESGQCTVAIVGGVNILVSPEEHMSFSKAGMLSSDGRCKTFSAQANGYVRGEGIGMLVLKKLSLAEQAGDHIYGVIRGSAENHGGRASSLTAPNPRAQADLLVAAYRKAGIDPRTVSYIEAHGTGTPLGDPIEINALKAAFSELMAAPTENKEAWCGIGSVKSNIGHLERAAGVTGVIKVLLQLHHKQLVKSLHCEQINPYIQLEGSPFYIVQETRPWEALRDQVGNPLPRRVGVSSFGFSGANAHVVLEEYVPGLRTPHPQSQPQPLVLIVLSARTQERLEAQVQQLLLWIQGEEAGQLSAEESVRLDDLAYTLQVGREAMEERLALQVGSLAELSEKLRAYLQDPQGGKGWYRGKTGQYKDVVALFGTDDELQETIGKWFQQEKYEKLLQGWVKGFRIKWRHLYGEHLPCRISLPTYPFARERYWISSETSPLTTASSSTTTYGTNSSEEPRHSSEVVPPISSFMVPPRDMDDLNGMASLPSLGQETLQERARTYFKKQLAALVKLPVQQINAQVELSSYGFDSILAIRFVSALEKAFGALPKTLLFEYSTVQSMAEYFLHNYPERLRSILGIEEIPVVALPQVTGERITNEQVGTRRGLVGTGLAPVRFPTAPVQKSVNSKDSQTGAGTVLMDGPTRDGHSQQDQEAKAGDIAIIGVAGRYPGARDLRAFWENLCNGRDCITEIPASRWDSRLYFDADKNKPGTTYSKWGGFLDGVDEFDPLFFNISPREAERTDPQERLFLECVYATLEDAGYTREELSMSQGNGLSGNVGVFVGVMYEEYQLFGAQAQIQGMPVALPGSPSSIANRVSYVCNFHGPSMAVDTMCSSSLTAIHLACQSIQHGGCGLAIAGGVNVSIHPNKYLLLGQNKYVSSQGSCQSFGVGADGYVPAEGVGAILLKPLVQAEADGDHIYAVIKATALNHGGKTNGYTVPNPQSQAEVIGQALKDARIDPRTITYIEAHGTGTVLGDPIEIAGLTRAFEQGMQDKDLLVPDAILQTQQWCVIGSVKSNIGHTESAAGIAGVTKVLLQMRYGQLVPSLHSEVLNPHIDFSATPFVVQQELCEWKRLQMRGTGEGQELPRRAGISSFGAGGSNAHVILEEYVERQQAGDGRNMRSLGPALIVLSARTREQLKERVQQLLIWLWGEEAGLLSAKESIRLDDLAYTLQVGREAMEERLAIHVRSLTELEEQLRKYLQDPQEAVDWHQGQVRPYKEIGELFDTDKELQATIEKWLQQGQYDKILRWWVNGLKISWHHLYTVGARTGVNPVPTAPARPRRISLPTYPFAREHYWIPVGVSPLPTPLVEAHQTYGTRHTDDSGRPWDGLHPLVQRNTSTLWAQQFSSTFYGDEFFLADHVIKGQRILPAVAYLEMARAAVREAIGDDETLEPSQIRLSNVVWIRPLIVSSHPVTVRIALEALESEAISFAIRRERQGEEAEEHIYCQGRALVEQAHEQQAPIQSLDLATLQSHCQRQVPASECYQRYRELGITYGPAMQAIEQLRVGKGMVLARLRLPVGVVPCADPGLVPGEAQTRMEEAHGDELYVLHPSMLDAALQASLGLAIGHGMQEPSLPFALSDLAIMGEVKASGWAWIVRRQGSTGESVFDIEVCDDEGRVAVHMGGLSTRTFHSGNSESLRAALLIPAWKEVTPVFSPPSEETAMLPPSLIVLCDLPESLASRIQAELALDGHCRSLSVGMPMGVVGVVPCADPTPQAPFQQLQREQRFQDVLVQLIQEVQRLWSRNTSSPSPTAPAVPFLVQVVVAHREEPSFFEALIGALKTAQQEEYPRLRGQLIEVEGELKEEELLASLRENQYRPQESHIRYSCGKRWVREWRELYASEVRNVGEASSPVSPMSPLSPTSPTSSPKMPWKKGGCYLITGGAGGLARLFVQEITRQVQDATIILVGRSALSTEQRAQLVDCGRKPVGSGLAPDSTLQAPQAEASGIHIDYQQVDVTDGPAVHALIQEILEKSGHLDGIIHAAGVLRDCLVRNKTPEDVQAVLAPKVVGVKHLDEASSQIPLDFFVLCSSISAVTGNVGQADYASANAYLDAFAHTRAAKVRVGERQGATVSINWPLWEEGGMRITAEQIQMMRAQTGIEVMDTETGMKMLYQALASGQAQVLAVYGQIERIKQRVLSQAKDLPAVGVGQVQVSRNKPQSLQVPLDGLREALTRIVSDLLKVQVERINAEAALTKYGFDSITFLEFANHLNQTYQLDLTPPVFFEYATIESLAQYLQTTYAAVLAPHFAKVSPEVLGQALEVTREVLIPDKGQPIEASPMTTVPRQRSRVARSFVQVPERQAAVPTSQPSCVCLPTDQTGANPIRLYPPQGISRSSLPSKGEFNEMLLAASHTRQAGHEALEERLALLEKEVPKPTLHRTDTYSVILAPNPSLLTGAGTNTIVLGDQLTGAVAIDPATDDPAYLSDIIQQGQRYGSIQRILITHGHPDHVGGAEALRAQLNVPLLAFSKKNVPFADEEIADNTLFPIGDDRLCALYTPGHTSDHLCFWLEKQRILFAGDLVTSSGPSFIFPPPEGDLQAYMHSLERVQHLESVKIVPAHGETILRPQELLTECLARCQQRKQQILAVVRNAPQGIDIQTIVRALYRNVDASLYDFMSTSVLLNLSWLEREGQVKHRENKQGEQKDYWIFTGDDRTNSFQALPERMQKT